LRARLFCDHERVGESAELNASLLLAIRDQIGASDLTHSH
jgi:hypothetical protein